MNKSILSVGIIFLALIALLLLQVLTNFSTGSELDYYLVKETTDAAMVDAYDITYYRQCGLHRIDKEKFVESFLLRFANNVNTTRGYTVGFYDINEVPPKVSVKVDSLTTLSFNAVEDGQKTKEAANISTSYDAIIESNNLIDPYTESEIKTSDSPICKGYK